MFRWHLVRRSSRLLVGSGIGIPEPLSCGKSNSRTNKTSVYDSSGKGEELKVLVLMGGISAERDVSLASGEAIVKAFGWFGNWNSRTTLVRKIQFPHEQDKRV
jgi:hypothetical protein